MKIRPTLTGIVVCLTVAACSSFQAYDGPPRPDNETALIKTTTITSRFVQGGTPPRSFLISVDALELQDLGEVRVLPGGRCVTLRIIYTPFSGDATIRQNSLLCFDALAGRTYEVRANIDDFSATWEAAVASLTTVTPKPCSRSSRKWDSTQRLADIPARITWSMPRFRSCRTRSLDSGP